MSTPDSAFVGPLPKIYQTYLVPLIFQAYADDVRNRLASRPLTRVLDVASGTGVVTRALAGALPESVSIVATDLNQAMLDHAASVGTSRPVEWRKADAMQLPFEDASFDAVVCSFGVMFFPDKIKAFSEARRVLRPGGVYVFTVWGPLDENPFAEVTTDTLAVMFPADPPRFLPRTPYGYNDVATIERELAAAGFKTAPAVDIVDVPSTADSPSIPAIGFVQGTPIRNEVEARNPAGLQAATDAVTEAIAKKYGRGRVESKIQAIIVTAEA